jgi:signal transduction histidine kinase
VSEAASGERTGATRSAIVPSLLDEAPCGFLSFTPAGHITMVNATLARMLEQDAAAIVGRQVKALFTTPTNIFYQTHFFPLLRMQGHADEIYLTLQSASGAVVHTLANAAIRERDGVEHVDCVLMRIHERQKYEQALLSARRTADEANHAKVEFLSMMSHDLRTPLNAVNGYTDLLLLGVRGELNEAQAKDVQRIQDAGKFLLGLINDILSFAKVELGKSELDVRAVDLNAALAQAEILIGNRFAEAGVDFVREPLSERLVVRADVDRFEQIVLNLLTNAAKFTDPGGRVTLSAMRDGPSVLVRVKDTGRGIPENRLEDIFRPLTQVNPDVDRRKGGIGLGLAIGRELARSMHGDLTVTSEVGRGSEFTLALPAE